MTWRAKVFMSLATAIIAGTLPGCVFDGEEEACDSTGRLSSAAAASSCVDTGENECVGTQRQGGREIRVDSYDIRLPSGQWVRSEGADFGSKPPLVTLAVSSRSGDEDATTTDLSVRQTLDTAGSTYRVAAFCDTGVAWLVATG